MHAQAAELQVGDHQRVVHLGVLEVQDAQAAHGRGLADHGARIPPRRGKPGVGGRISTLGRLKTRGSMPKTPSADIARGASMLNSQIADAPLAGGLPLATAAELQDDLMTATNDLDRLQRLLADACDTLMRDFCGASAQLDTLAGAEAAAIAALRGQLGSAVVALQFQDMASQLICHTARRLRACADRIARQALPDDEDGEAVVETAPLRPNPVTQDEMDAGSIELF
jgi:hypothetical protein